MLGAWEKKICLVGLARLSLDNGYLENLDNGLSNKYEKNLKNRNKI
jgi:hypothetical protein